jgi:multiple sugar transport system substrate-binding protein
MSGFVGLTWDHPRGREALQAAEFPELRWELQPLEGFESSPIGELAERYDLIVLDHPHLGDALAAGCLRPMEDFFGSDELDGWAAEAVGPSARAYSLAGQTWALPLDAATQVSARRPQLLETSPQTWTQVLDLDVPVAPSMAGPHAFLSFCSIAVSLGADLSSDFFDRGTAIAALDILTALAMSAPQETRELNPIGLLELMSTTDIVAYAPLVYGYVNYAQRLAFGAAPIGTRIGSTIGGTGIALTRRSEPTPALLDHLRWLMSREAQLEFIPSHSGQPSARSAWTDPAVNAGAGHFYSNTLETIEHSWVRPRFPGYIRFQSEAAAIIREGAEIPRTVDRLADAYRKASA